MEDSPRYLCNLSVLADLYWKSDKKKAEGYAKRIVNADISRYPKPVSKIRLSKKKLRVSGGSGKKWHSVIGSHSAIHCLL